MGKVFCLASVSIYILYSRVFECWKEFWALPCASGTTTRMDEITRQRNRSNFNPSEDSVVRSRPRLSERFFKEIKKHLLSNPEVKRCVLTKSEKDPTSEISKSIESGFREENRQSSDTMKIKKSDTLAKVSDSFPKTPTLTGRKRLQRVYNVEDIPLPDEKSKTSAQPASNRKFVICASQDIRTYGEAAQNLAQKKTSTTNINPLPNDLQISLTAVTKESILSTSPVSSCESPESLSEERSELHELPEERIASQVRDSLYEPSPVCGTPVTHHRVRISKVGAEGSYSPYASPESTYYEIPYSDNHLNHSYPETQLRNYENKAEFSCFKETTDTSGEPLQPINFPNFRTPLPTLHSRWSTPSSSRVVSNPDMEHFSKPPVYNVPWSTHSRSRSWNDPCQKEHGGIASRNLVRMTNWRKSQESYVQKNFSQDPQATSVSPISHWRHESRYLPYDIKTDKKRTHHPDAFSRRSHERLPKEKRLEGTITRAASLESVGLRSPQTPKHMEPSCFYHLSPDRVYRHSFRQRSCGANCNSNEKNENSGFLPTSPLLTWTPPQMHFLPPFYLPMQKPDDPLEPNLMGHQLLGDSQLLRFSRQILGKSNRTSDNMRYLGLCVSGQTIQELLQKIKAKFYPVGDRVILMIGTNNFLQNHRVEVIMDAWDELISYLLCVQSRRLLLLTVPPIPKLADNESHWEELEQVNTFIRGYAGGTQDVVTVADISSLFLSGPKQCCVDYFEKTYGDSDRVDLIHLNERGFSRLRDYLTDNRML